MSERVSNRIMTFGGMITIDGKPQLDLWGRQRADRVISYYFANQDRFKSPESWILCSGGWPRIGRNMDKPPLESREGHLTAQYIHAQGVPSHLIEEEVESFSTVTNLTNSLRGGYLNPTAFSPEDKLGLVSNPNHLRRCIKTIGRIGIDKANIQRIATEQPDSRLRELLVGAIYSAALLGAHDPSKLEQREERYVVPILNTIQQLSGVVAGLAPQN